MESFEELQAFARERERLITRLTEQRHDLDRWLETHVGQSGDMSALDLATLASLVQLRRDTLMELVNLDDGVLERLLMRRKKESSERYSDTP